MTEITREMLDELREKTMKAPYKTLERREPEGPGGRGAARIHGGFTGDGRSIHPRISIEENLTPGGKFLHARMAEYIEATDPETMKALLLFIERQHELLKATLQAVNDGYVDAGEDFIIKLSATVKRLEEDHDATTE